MFRVVIQLGAIPCGGGAVLGQAVAPSACGMAASSPSPASGASGSRWSPPPLPVLVISPLDDWMEAHFYNYITVAAMLILYGVLFLVVESRRTAPHVTHLEQITYRDALIIGVWQMLAIIPGTSRSGATIVGGLLLGLSRACVAEFTFYLAIPVMAGASPCSRCSNSPSRCRHHRHRGGCAGGGGRGGFRGQPGGYPLPDGLRQAPQLHLLRHLPHRPRPCGAGRGSGVCNGVKSNSGLLRPLGPGEGLFLRLSVQRAIIFFREYERGKQEPRT